MPTLHIVMPVFNEARTLRACVERVLRAPLPAGWERRIEMVDDRSSEENFRVVQQIVQELACAADDPTLARGARGFEQKHPTLARGAGSDSGREKPVIRLHRHAVNRGKGAALQTGFDAVLGDASTREDDLVIIQDADLEYDPNDYAALMQVMVQGGDVGADAALGTRWGGHNPVRGIARRIHSAGNGMLTIASNLMTGLRVRDMECCYKVFRVDVLRRLRPMLTEERFGIEPQMVAGLSRLKARVAEVAVSYHPRSVEEGKKIGWKDAMRAMWVIMRERFGRSSK
jgi:glycosyltransferase involved in cell wall biosynthesis